MKLFVKISLFILIGTVGFCCRQDKLKVDDESVTALTVDAQTTNIEFFWKNEDGGNFGSLENLKKYAENKGKRLRFAMNGGMYQADGKPLGLFIQNHLVVTPLNRRKAEGNFYLQPNGIFYLTDQKKAFVETTDNFQINENIRFATQSGPMLLIDGQINPLFTPNSANLNVRNGVCVLENGQIIFAVSRREINFYDFAAFFKNAGCRNALYLDGFVSRMYAPEANISQTDGNFGVIIGIIE